jgi:hypothetical protein
MRGAHRVVGPISDAISDVEGGRRGDNLRRLQMQAAGPGMGERGRRGVGDRGDAGERERAGSRERMGRVIEALFLGRVGGATKNGFQVWVPRWRALWPTATRPRMGFRYGCPVGEHYGLLQWCFRPHFGI